MQSEINKNVMLAAGIIIYKIINNKMYILIVNKSGIYEDIGAEISTENNDNIYDIISSQIEKKTNYIIKYDNIIKRLENATSIYVPKFQHNIFLIKANNNEMNLKHTDFGDYDNHNNYSRTIGWISREILMDPLVLKFKVNSRLKNKIFFSKLRDIEKSFKYTKKLFK